MSIPPVLPGSYTPMPRQTVFVPQNQRGRSPTRSVSRSRSPSTHRSLSRSPSPHPNIIPAPPIPQMQQSMGSYPWQMQQQLQQQQQGFQPPRFGHPVPSPKPVGVTATTTQGHVYNIQEQIWNNDDREWVQYDAPPPPDYKGAIFIVYHRRQKRQTGRLRREETDTFTVVDILEQKLTKALRDVCTNVEELFGRQPQFTLSKLYPHIDGISAHITELEKDEEDLEIVKMLRSFLEVVQAEYAPHKEKFDTLIQEGKITSEFLWAIFKPGTRVRTNHYLTKDIAGSIIDSVTAVSGLGTAFTMNGRTLNWNGTEFEHCVWSYSLPYLWEPRSLSDLPVTVLTDDELQYLKDRGRKYTEFTGVKHVHVKGTFYGAAEKKIDGRCMLDTLTYRSGRVLQRPGSWFPQPIRPAAVSRIPVAPYTGFSPMPPAQMQQMQMQQQYQQQQMQFQQQQMMQQAQQMQYMQPPVSLPESDDEGDSPNTYKSMKTVPEDLMWLLPPTLFGFDFGTKKWGEFYVQEIRPAEYEEKVWDRLVLDDDIKTIIRSIVDARGKPNGTAMINDWIKGKGGGLVVLLHGVAGVGKTLTAEAVAELLHRPLYTVGSGELGWMASEVEASLKTHLELATSWNAVLLIDEADVFLEKRGTADLMRNSLVATFLRLLEYHSGMLFLTTNRVKAFDEAFLSRVSVAIKYHELDIQQRGQIWRQFLEFVLEQKVDGKCTEIDPELLQDECLKELAMKPFNGRVIKNIVRTAQALSISSEEPLSMRHIRTVTGITEKFVIDTENVRNRDGADAESLDLANEVASLY